MKKCYISISRERSGKVFFPRGDAHVGSKVIWYWSRTLWGVTAFITREGKTKKKMWHTKPKIRGFRIGKDVSAQESFHLDCQKLLKHGFIGNQSHLERVRCFARKGSVEVFYFTCDFLLCFHQNDLWFLQFYTPVSLQWALTRTIEGEVL